MREELDSKGHVVLQTPRSDSIHCTYTGRNIGVDTHGITLRRTRHLQPERYHIAWISISCIETLLDTLWEYHQNQPDLEDKIYSRIDIGEQFALRRTGSTRGMCLACNEQIIKKTDGRAFCFSSSSTPVFLHDDEECIEYLENALLEIHERHEEFSAHFL